MIFLQMKKQKHFKKNFFFFLLKGILDICYEIVGISDYSLKFDIS